MQGLPGGGLGEVFLEGELLGFCSIERRGVFRAAST